MKVTVKNQVKIGNLKPGQAFRFAEGCYLVVGYELHTVNCHTANVVCLNLENDQICFMGKNLEVVQYGIEIILTGYSF